MLRANLDDVVRTTLKCREHALRHNLRDLQGPWRLGRFFGFAENAGTKIINQMRLEEPQNADQEQIVDRMTSLILEAEAPLERANREAWAWSQRDA